MTAVDDDADENRLLRYTIISVSPDAPTMGIGGFEIDVNTGTVRTTGSFDREVFGGLYSIAVSFKLLSPPSFLPPSFSPLHLSLPHSFPPFLPPSLSPFLFPPSLITPSLLPPSLTPSPDIGTRQWSSSSQWQYQTYRLPHRHQ